jgi:tripartite-type tricarboxylate transporter receptor subunit TctC
MVRRALLLIFVWALSTPCYAQFYKGKTLTLLVNYGAGGNADTEARVYQQFLPKYIPGHPSVIIQNAPGAGGFNAMNMLGLGIGSRNDGLTAGYFTVGATGPIINDPSLKVRIYDFIIVAGLRGWNLTYARKDAPPGIEKPVDIVKAKHLYVGGYSRASAQDTRLRLALEILNVPFTMVTGFPGTNELNKAMIDNEVSFTGSSLPGYQTQVMPQIIKPGLGIPIFQYSYIGPDGRAAGNPQLEAQGIPLFEEVYQQAYGKPPSGLKYQALLLLNDIGTQLQRGIVLPKGSPPEAVRDLREAFAKATADPQFIAQYQRVTGEKPDLVAADELKPLFQRMRAIDPAVKTLLQKDIGE